MPTSLPAPGTSPTPPPKPPDYVKKTCKMTTSAKPSLNRLSFLSLAVCLASVPLAHAQAASEPKSSLPNIVTIVLDDLSPAYFRSYGGRTPTPNFDRLAHEGLQFTRAYCTSSICNPSRYTMLTGLYPGRSDSVIQQTPEDEPYWVSFNADLTENSPSIARDMKAAGYHTGYIGKWHSGWEFEADLTNFRNIDFNDPAQLKIMAREYEIRLSRIRQITGFDVVGSLVPGNLDAAHRDGHPLGNHNPEWQTHAAMDFITESAGHDAPFFLHIAYTPPHSPNNLDMLEDDGLATQAGPLEKPLPLHALRASVKARMGAAGIETTGELASINAGTIIMDDQVGAILDLLAQLNIAENTMVVLLADHNLYGKGSPYQAGAQVPLVIRWPQTIAPGTQTDQLVSLIDLVPTFHEVAGLDLPTDGVSMLALLRGESLGRRPVYGEVGYFRTLIDTRFQYVAFRLPQKNIDAVNSGESTIVLDSRRGNGIGIFTPMNLPFKPAHLEPEQLYDLSTDPFQRVNLAYHPAYQDVVADLRKQLIAITTTFDRPFAEKTPEGMLTKAYAEAARQRLLLAQGQARFADKYDSERVLNLNLPDPEQ